MVEPELETSQFDFKIGVPNYLMYYTEKEPCKQLGESIPGREHNKCKGPQAERAWPDLGTDSELVALERTD